MGTGFRLSQEPSRESEVEFVTTHWHGDTLQYIETCSGLREVDVSGKGAVLRSVALRAREEEKRLLVLFRETSSGSF